MEVHIGIPQEKREVVAQELARLPADTNTLYLKTQNLHWNVNGPMFQKLHALFNCCCPQRKGWSCRSPSACLIVRLLKVDEVFWFFPVIGVSLNSTPSQAVIFLTSNTVASELPPLLGNDFARFPDQNQLVDNSKQIVNKMIIYF